MFSPKLHLCVKLKGLVTVKLKGLVTVKLTKVKHDLRGGPEKDPVY